MLFNEPKLLKTRPVAADVAASRVSVLFNEPKLLKMRRFAVFPPRGACFSALQRAEIAEKFPSLEEAVREYKCFSALQRAEIAENELSAALAPSTQSFSALQRAEIAENVVTAATAAY